MSADCRTRNGRREATNAVKRSASLAHMVSLQRSVLETALGARDRRLDATGSLASWMC
jgi:hypothetical protein